MHKHDIDLIMSLADGTLDAAEIPAAEASIAACEACSLDLALQRLSMDALTAAPSVTLTEMESARMRRTLRADLGLAAAAEAAAVATVRERRFSWTGALSAAAVLLIVVLAAPTLNLLGGSDDDASTAQDFFAASDTTTTVAASRTTTAAEGLTSEDGAGEPPTADLGIADSEERQASTAAADPVARLREDLSLDDIAQAYQSSFRTPDVYPTAGIPPATDEFDRCAEVGVSELETEGTTVNQWSFAGLTTEDGREAAVMAYDTDSGDVVVMLQDAETCEIVDSS
jgi:hypothetical protein